MITPPQGDNKDYQREWGMMLKAAGAPLASFKGRVRLTEMSKKPWPTADRSTYYYKIEKVGAGNTNGSKPEVSEDLINAALQVISGGQYTEATVGLALAKSPSCNTNPALTGSFLDGTFVAEQVAAGRLTKDEAGVLAVIS